MAKGRKTGGRTRGTPNKATFEARVFCGSIIDDPVYQAKLRRRAIRGTLSPAIEALLWYYAKGKPEHLELSVDAVLLERKARLREALKRTADIIDVEPVRKLLEESRGVECTH